MKITKTQIATILLIIGSIIWEYYVQLWTKTETGPIIRVDLVLILPVILLMVILPIMQIVKKNK